MCNSVKFETGQNLPPVLKQYHVLHNSAHGVQTQAKRQYGSIILTGLRASIGVTDSYSRVTCSYAFLIVCIPFQLGIIILRKHQPYNWVSARKDSNLPHSSTSMCQCQQKPRTRKVWGRANLFFGLRQYAISFLFGKALLGSGLSSNFSGLSSTLSPSLLQ